MTAFNYELNLRRIISILIAVGKLIEASTSEDEFIEEICSPHGRLLQKTVWLQKLLWC